MGRGVGQGRQASGLAEVDAAKGLSSTSAQMGGGKDLLLALSEQEDEQGLREAGGELGGLRIRGDDALDGEASGTCLRIIRQFLEGEFSEVVRNA